VPPADVVPPEPAAGLGRLAADAGLRAVAGFADAGLRAVAGFADATVRRPAAGFADATVRPVAAGFAVEREAEAVLRAAGFAVEREAEAALRAAGFAAEAGLRAAGFAVEREAEAVLRAAGFAADGDDCAAAAGVVALDEDLDPRTADGRDVVDPAAVPVAAGAAPRRANGFAAGRRVAPAVPRGLTSSAVTRLLSPSMSLRSPLISPSTRSSSTSRMRLAAFVTSFARPRVDLAPSAEAEKVRSTAWRTASTASAAPAAALSFLLRFLSFFGMAGRS